MLTQIAAARKRPDPKKRTEVLDGNGLYLVIQPGGGKSWALRYELAGRTAKMTLGRFAEQDTGEEPAVGGHMTLGAARQLAGRMRRDLEAGRDPRHERSGAKWLEAVQAYGKHVRASLRRPAERLRMLGLNPETLEPVPGGLAQMWRDRQADAVTDTDIIRAAERAVTHGIPGMKKRGSEPRPDRERKVKAALCECFSWLREKRWVRLNPGELVKKPKAGERERVLTDAELAKVWEACPALTEPYGRAVRLMILTGCRREEVAGMAASELRDGGEWVIPGDRTKNGRTHTLRLPELALAQLLPPGDAGPFLFSTTGGKRPISGWSKVLTRLNAAVGGEHFTFHDLRRTFATGLAKMGTPVQVTERAINHVSGSVSGVAAIYNRHSYTEEVAAALVAWERRVRSILGEVQDNVVEMRVAG